MVDTLPQGFWLDTVDSTMAEAKRLIQAGQIRDTAFIVAKHQTQGRGTQGRNWISPDDAGIYLSVVHVAPPGVTYTLTNIYTQAAGVACIEALQLATDVQCAIKPINDLYFNDQKLGGILVESEVSVEGITTLITGVGINTHRAVRDLTERAHPGVEPISLEDILSVAAFAQFSSESLIETLIAKICFTYNLIWNGQEAQITRRWRQYQLSISK